MIFFRQKRGYEILGCLQAWPDHVCMYSCVYVSTIYGKDQQELITSACAFAGVFFFLPLLEEAGYGISDLFSYTYQKPSVAPAKVFTTGSKTLKYIIQDE